MTNLLRHVVKRERENIADSNLVVYALPDLSISDATRLGISIGALVCEDVGYTIANKKMLDHKIQRNRSVVQKTIIADVLICEAKDKARLDLHDINYYELNRRYSCSRYVASLMRSGTGSYRLFIFLLLLVIYLLKLTLCNIHVILISNFLSYFLDKEVHDALKACFKKVHSEIYGGRYGFDEWCSPDEISPERMIYTQEKLVRLRSKYMQDCPDAVGPIEERRNVLAAQGQLTQKKKENELRRDIISFTRSLVHECKQLKIKLDQINESPSLAGYKY